ncbi:Otogelin-like protein [Sciurus carolinensis]|uniref:Otogelin-like protein n=1 Tax=Sciurus carolinensis TaxID=30640 RepID=A0AA41N1W5_SCICA|nr:Otogelin-like protein [Sciurus carolinensis]
MVEDQQGLTLPQTIGQVFIEKLADYILVKTTFGFSLAWDGISGIYLKLSEEHNGKSCGLCGNHNYIQSDDFIIQQEDYTEDIAMFANSWLVQTSDDTKCVPTPSDFPNPCSSGMPAFEAIFFKCQILLQFPFLSCHEYIDPYLYIASCVNDLCKTDDDETYCRAATEYARACSHAGYPIQDWRDDFPACIQCSVVGDSHFTTFDGRHYSFIGMCQYILVKGTGKDKFTITLQKAPCEQNLGLVCLQSITLILEDDFNKQVTLSRGGQILTSPNQGFNLKGIVEIQTLSSLFILLKTTFGLKILFAIDGERIYIQLTSAWKRRTLGLCGTFNGNIRDDFLSPSGMIEGTPQLHANAWRVSSTCFAPVHVPMVDPCNINQQNIGYAAHCDVIHQELFASCHIYISPGLYYQLCRHDACKCGSPCLCNALAHYAYLCGQRGVPIDFRTQISFCAVVCQKGMLYHHCSSFCRHSCTSLSSPEQCNDDCAEGCNCPEGKFYEDTLNFCVPIYHCRCHYRGSVYQPGELIPTPSGLCQCSNGTVQCDESATPSTVHVCPEGKQYFDCRFPDPELPAGGVNCETTCANLAMNFTCAPSSPCISGCVCAPGVCRRGMFNCTYYPCPAVCTIYGDRHYHSFDGLEYDYISDCQVFLIKANDSDISVIAQNKKCFDNDIVCSKSVLISVGDTEIYLNDTPYKQKRSGFFLESKPTYQLWKAGHYTVVYFPEKDITILWDKKTTIHIKVGPQWKNKLSGLCGNFDKCTSNDMTTSNNLEVRNAQVFGDSWALGQIDVTSFAKNCHEDTCNCNLGGDCECLCTNVAAYAYKCCQEGVSVPWRSSTVCSLDCEYYNEALALVSLESAERPNYFLCVHKDDSLSLELWEANSGFHRSATFFHHRDLWIPGYSAFELYSKKGFFITFTDFNVRASKYDDSEEFKQSSSFSIEEIQAVVPYRRMCEWRYEPCASPCFKTCSDPEALACKFLPPERAPYELCGSYFTQIRIKAEHLCFFVGIPVIPTEPALVPPGRCSMLSELSIITFDGNNAALYSMASYILVRIPGEIIVAHIEKCSLNQVEVDSIVVPLPFSNQDLSIEDSGTMYVITTPAGLIIKWAHLTGIIDIHFSFRFNLSSYTEGLCGICNENPDDDLRMQNGTIIVNMEDIELFIESWEIEKSFEVTTRRPVRNCTEHDCSPCIELLNRRVFIPCHDKVSPKNFCEKMWINYTYFWNYECDALSAYVALCNKFDICIHWRTPDYCTCTDSEDQPRTAGEIWNGGTDECALYKCLESGSIIPVEPDCEEEPSPVCEREAEIVIGIIDKLTCCSKEVCGCDMTLCETTIPICTTSQKLVVGYSPLSCCPQYKCECDPLKCPVISTPECREDEFMIQVQQGEPCCFPPLCACEPCTEPIPLCSDGEFLTVDLNTTHLCCPQYYCGKREERICQKVTIKSVIRKQDCVSQTSINVASCDGKCPSATIYNINVESHLRFCKCCRENGVRNLTVPLYCSGNGTEIMYTLQEPIDCTCQWN